MTRFCKQSRRSEATQPPLDLTPEAVRMVRAAMARNGLEDHGLRIAIVPAGCSQTRYEIEFQRAAQPDDTVLDIHGIRIFVDPASEPYLRGMVLDYVRGLNAAGFKFLTP